MKRLWQIVSIDLPWAVSNWLWTQIINPLVAGLLQMTPRRMVYLAFFMMFAVAFVWAAAEIAFPADTALLLAGDSALYYEIATFTTLVVVQGRLARAILPMVRLLRRSGQSILRVAARARRSIRRPRLFDRSDSDDVPDGAFVFA